MGAGAIAGFVELTQRTVADGERMPFAGPGPFVSNVGRRQFRGNHLLGLETFDRAVDDALRTEILGTVDLELELGDSPIGYHGLGQEILGAEAEIADGAVTENFLPKAMI